ncbi:MAG: hypothetical protein F3745_07610 [Nitrospinae bacterium]|nr:hypothetical protein [Nitrospinota bacterium]
MWKNIFLESCLLSALIFGGFYLNTMFLQDELYSKDNKKVHISGSANNLKNHISGQMSEQNTTDHISGINTPAKTSQ